MSVASVKRDYYEVLGVTKTALLNAASVSGLALTTEVMITELKEKKSEANAVTGAVV